METERLKTLAAIISAIALSSCTIVVDTQDFLRPTTSAGADATAFIGRIPPDYTVVTDFIPTADGEELYRVRLENPHANTTVLYWGGNLFNIHETAPDVASLLTREWRPNIVFVDYRGYGKSSGKPTVEFLRIDAQQVFSEERRRATAEGKKLVVSGYSLGGAIAGTVLTDHVDGAILIATFTTVNDLVGASLPWYYKPFVAVKLSSELKKLNTLKKVSVYRGPLLIIAGQLDDTTPLKMAHALYDASAATSGKKRLVIVPGTDHHSVHDATETRAALLQFAKANRL